MKILRYEETETFFKELDRAAKAKQPISIDVPQGYIPPKSLLRKRLRDKKG